MTRRAHRDFDALTEAQVVTGRTAARRVSAAGLLPADSPKRITELLDAIDHVAEAATGDRSFLHLKPAPGPAAGPLRARI